MSKSGVILFGVALLCIYLLQKETSQSAENRYQVESVGMLSVILDGKTGSIRFCNAQKCRSPKDEYPEWNDSPIGSSDEIDFNDKGVQP